MLSTDDELDILERHKTSELPSGIYSCGIKSIKGVRARACCITLLVVEMRYYNAARLLPT
jgi:hypothetical protein